MSSERVQSSLSVVIVTYNSSSTLPGLLDSLPAGLAGIERSEVVIADNASSDLSADIAAAHPIGARVFRTGRNGGYAAGINAALSAISSDADVLILNPDIRLLPGAAAPLTAHLRDGAGIAVPHILHEDGTEAPSLRREPSIVTAWSDALLTGRLRARIDIGETILGPARYRSDGLVDWASGAALAVAARTRRQVGEWDETFFLYSEETDFQRRARSKGLTVAFVRQSEMVHIGGDYARNPRLYAMLTANRIGYYARYHGPLATTAFRLGVLAGEAIRSANGSAVHRAGLGAALRRWSPPAETLATAAHEFSDA
jgi:N-acetylglucosaminyl-diphospho-decaprenol L-rhamnosyltransferase